MTVVPLVTEICDNNAKSLFHLNPKLCHHKTCGSPTLSVHGTWGVVVGSLDSARYPTAPFYLLSSEVGNLRWSPVLNSYTMHCGSKTLSHRGSASPCPNMTGLLCEYALTLQHFTALQRIMP